MVRDPRPQDVVDVARGLAWELDRRGQAYSVGGAIALGYWATPRGTLDVDLTLFLPPERPSECIWLLQEIGCELQSSEAQQSLVEHGFCRATYGGFRVDVFLPIAPFYEIARQRRQTVDLEGQPVMIWDAESLAVFKFMFFRDKDLVDIRQMLRSLGPNFDRNWVRSRLVEIFSERDPRVSRWDEITGEPPAAP